MADYPSNDFYNMPIQPQHKTDGSPLLVEIDYPEGKAYVKVWRAHVGRIPLYLLDTNIPENEESGLRDITDYLYGGDERMRIKQEILLGIGGYRVLNALNIQPTVCHINEGHAAFLTLERIRQFMAGTDIGFDEAREATTAGNIFTTHTPVPAGIDWFPPDLVKHYFRNYINTLDISEEKFLGLGRKNPSDNSSEFSPALVALRLSTMANGVSQSHARVSRSMWKGLWNKIPDHEVPIKAITNGIHTRSWVSEDMQSLFDRYLGPKWIVDLTNQDVWTQISQIPDTELWRTHERRRERLIAFAQQRQVKKRHKSFDQSITSNKSYEMHETSTTKLNSAALTIGFARRFATYKRATLIFNDRDRLAKILNDPDRPVQLIFSGKAHPHDHEGKVFIQQIYKISEEQRFKNKILFIENYDICVGRYLVEGVDVWLNTPLPPNEASGTSGMKAAANGALNLSMTDGWWAEAKHLGGGWTIEATSESDDPKSIDKAHANAIYDLLENEVVPLFYERDAIDDIPYGWVAKMKIAMQNLAPVFNTKRMVSEYAERLYFPAHKRWLNLNKDNTRRGIAFANWKANIQKHWRNLRIEEYFEKTQKDSVQQKISSLSVGESVSIKAVVHTDALFPNELAVQIYHGVLDATGEIHNGSATPMDYIEDLGGGKFIFEGKLTLNQTGLHGYTLRVLPYHEDLQSVFDLGLIKWT